ncbi:MAG: MBL fold metallo-hydrolase, partial [Clostridiales bacterium]|nr:MBL fold metallo-hydrolase [Clostridiales bacterium]
TIDGLTIEILFDSRYYEKMSNLNDTSLVYKLTLANKTTVLFLGDLAQIGGEYLADKHGIKLKSDIVQMSHHGQRGVSRRVYELIRPEICLWPTIRSVWENDAGAGYNTGQWLTLETRSWMNELDVKMHGIMKDGDIRLI